MKKLNLTSKQMNRRHYLRNRAKKIAYAKLYRETHKEEIDLYYKNNEEKIKLYREKHTEQTRLYNKQYKLNNKECLKRVNRMDYLKNQEQIKLRSKIWYEQNKDKARKQRNEYIKKRRQIDVNFKLALFLRRTQYRLLNQQNKEKFCSSNKLIGCSIPEFRKYLENKFKKGMNWDNYGIYGWHIDHIKPLASFNLSNYFAMLRASHYTNTQPLWAKENLQKHAKI